MLRKEATAVGRGEDMQLKVRRLQLAASALAATSMPLTAADEAGGVTCRPNTAGCFRCTATRGQGGAVRVASVLGTLLILASTALAAGTASTRVLVPGLKPGSTVRTRQGLIGRYDGLYLQLHAGGTRHPVTDFAALAGHVHISTPAMALAYCRLCTMAPLVGYLWGGDRAYEVEIVRADEADALPTFGLPLSSAIWGRLSDLVPQGDVSSAPAGLVPSVAFRRAGFGRASADVSGTRFIVRRWLWDVQLDGGAGWPVEHVEEVVGRDGSYRRRVLVSHTTEWYRLHRGVTLDWPFMIE